MKNLISSLLSIMLLALLTSCAFDSAALPKQEPDIRGSITQINPESDDPNIFGTMLVESQQETNTHYDKAAITVTTETRISEQTAQDRQPANFEALQVGQRVEVWFTGPVAESFPVQATALEIVILQ